MNEHLLIDIGKSIFAAALFGVPAYFLGIPLIIAYITAGVVLGSRLGIGTIASPENISVLSEIGLVLLLFILGLEIDLRKLMQAGRAVLLNGALQFIGCAVLAYGFFLPYTANSDLGTFSLLYLAIACSLSSTLVVIKILSDKLNLNSLPSRITIGILVIQDIWAIGFLALQPNLQKLDVLTLLISVSKVVVLVATAWFFARYLLPRVFRRIAKQPELMLIVSMGWCFGLCGVADQLKLSLEMGALVAGVSVASFPYHLDVAAKISSLRDFFISLFFVGLGLQVPMPTADVITLAALISIFIWISRFLTIYPVLHYLGYGNRSSVLPAINLSQLSEFSLVLASLGIGLGHIKKELLSAFVLALVVTSILSSIAIPEGHAIYRFLNPMLEWLGLRDSVGKEDEESKPTTDRPRVILLGFYREASSLIHEIMSKYSTAALKQFMVVDFNPEAHHKLKSLGISCTYGDISHIDTLRQLPLDTAEVLVCTMPDQILKGTTNLKLLRLLKKLAPQAKVVVTAEQIDHALEMYRQGATYVFIPRIISAYYLADTLERIISNNAVGVSLAAQEYLKIRHEVLP